MIWLIYILNFFLWLIAGVVIGSGFTSLGFGMIYFVLGYIFSLIVLKFSDNFAVSDLDRLANPPFSVWLKKMVWSNSIAGVLVLVFLVVISLFFQS
jgi:hypothetical protein